MLEKSTMVVLYNRQRSSEIMCIMKHLAAWSPGQVHIMNDQSADTRAGPHMWNKIASSRSESRISMSLILCTVLCHSSSDAANRTGRPHVSIGEYCIPVHISMLCLVTPVNLLLQDDAVDARLEEREHQTRLSLEIAQTIEYLCRGLGGHCVEDGRKLQTDKASGQDWGFRGKGIKGFARRTFFMLSANLSYSSRTSCSSGESSGGDSNALDAGRSSIFPSCARGFVNGRWFRTVLASRGRTVQTRQSSVVEILTWRGAGWAVAGPRV